MRDFLILAGMAIAIGCGLYGAGKNNPLHFKIGSVIAAIAMCVGLAYFGYRPYFGGTNHDIGTYFGCIMLTFGVQAWLLFRGLSLHSKESDYEKQREMAVKAIKDQLKATDETGSLGKNRMDTDNKKSEPEGSA